MACVFKKAVTRPLPPGAEVVVRVQKTTASQAGGSKAVAKVEVRVARRRDGKGKVRTADVTPVNDGADRIREESRTDFARYRADKGLVVEAPTGCRNRSAALGFLQVVPEQNHAARRRGLGCRICTSI